MQREQALQELAAIIEANPNCNFEIDNDCWYITKPNPNYNKDAEATDENSPTIEIAESGTYWWSTNWYSESNDYGVGLAEVLIFMLNKRGFNISASGV